MTNILLHNSWLGLLFCFQGLKPFKGAIHTSPRGGNDLETEIHLSTSGQLFREEAQAAFYDLLEKSCESMFLHQPPASWSVLGLPLAQRSMSAENEVTGRDDQVISHTAWACLIQERIC